MLRCCRAFLHSAFVPQSEASEGVIFSCCTYASFPGFLGRLLAPADALPRGPTYPSADWLARAGQGERASEVGGAMR